MKEIYEMRIQVGHLLSCLRKLSEQAGITHHKIIYKLLTDSSDTCDEIKKQIETYLKTDIFSRLFKEGAIRKKLSML